MAGTSSISGVISGLQTDQILEKLRQIEMTPVYRLQSKQAELNKRLSVWQSFNTKLLSLKTALSPLTLPYNFSAHTVSVSNSLVCSASASASAALGDTAFSVVALATAEQMSSQGYASDADVIGTGTIVLNGKTITTDGLTLAGLRDAINGAGAGVQASVVNTGAGATPYRLLLTSTSTGSAGAIAATVNVTGAGAPVLTTVQAAQDAHLRFGSGEAAVDVYRSSNHITDVITGVTLDLVGTGEVSLHVAGDTAAVQEKVEALVKAYNEVTAFIKEQSKFDSTTNTSSPLFGDINLMHIEDSLYRTFSEPVAGLPPEMCLLSQVGLRRNMEGELTLDSAMLEQALVADPTAVTKLFASYAECASDITYISSTQATKASGPEGYALEITQVATQARVTAGVAQSAPLAGDETLTLNGVAIALSAGMDQAAVLAAINAVSSQTGVRASATGSDGTGTGAYLTLTRIGYGSALHLTASSTVSNAGGASSGIGTVVVTETSPGGEAGTGTGAAGVDVAGLIAGVAASGNGQTLTATSGDAAGLALLVRAVSTGVKPPVIFTRGAVTDLADMLAFLTEDSDSAYGVATDALENEVSRLTDEIASAQASVDAKMKVLTTQFESMEASLSKLHTQSSQLLNQLQALASTSWS